MKRPSTRAETPDLTEHPALPHVDSRRLSRMRAALMKYYDAHARDLPWRRTRNPYAIWVSEIMLQQTQVDTVKPRYSAFLKQFPTVQSLALAEESQVCEAWAGLGYYRRARNLHAAARQIVQMHGGRIPRSSISLMKLPGIGRYTAGAIGSIAFGEEAPVVDGNVKRVLSRAFALNEPVDSPRGQRWMWDVAESLVHGERPGDLNQALMELGAMVCTPAGPDCGACPWGRTCQAKAEGRVGELPLSAKRRPRQPLAVAFAWCEAPGGGLWLEQRPVEGLWAGLWELPSATGATSKAAREALAARLGGLGSTALATVKHELTHRKVTAKVYRPRLPRGSDRVALNVILAECRAWDSPCEAPISALARKAILATEQVVRGALGLPVLPPDAAL